MLAPFTWILNKSSEMCEQNSAPKLLSVSLGPSGIGGIIEVLSNLLMYLPQNGINNSLGENDLEHPTQPLLEPSRDRQMPPLAGQYYINLCLFPMGAVRTLVRYLHKLISIITIYWSTLPKTSFKSLGTRMNNVTVRTH